MSNSWRYIKAFDARRSANAERPHEANFVTSSQTGSSDAPKRPLDVMSHGGTGEVMSAILALIQGTMPEVNWDQIDKTAVSSSSYEYLFSYKGNQMFKITVANPFGDYSITVAVISGIITEDGLSAIALESGDELLLEG